MKYIFYALAFCNVSFLLAGEQPIAINDPVYALLHAATLSHNYLIINKFVPTPKPFDLDLTKVKKIKSTQMNNATTVLEAYQANMRDGSSVTYFIDYKGEHAGQLMVFESGFESDEDLDKKPAFRTGKLKDFVDLKVEYLRRKELEEKQSSSYCIKQKNQKH